MSRRSLSLMPKICWTYTALGLLFFIYASALFAASDSHFAIEGWDTEKGLPEMAVFALAQTRDGYLWVGTGDGLARFDGVRFKRYSEDEAANLSGSKVVKLFEDRSGNLWVATEAAAVMIIGVDGKIVNLPIGDASTTGPLVSICEDRAGGVWLRMAKGQLYWYALGKSHQIASNCRALVADDSGLIWLGTQDGRLLGLGPVSDSVKAAVFPVSYELPAGNIDLLLACRRGGYWRLANGRIQKWRMDHLEKDFGAYPWTGAVIWAACEDSDGNLIVGTSARVCIGRKLMEALSALKGYPTLTFGR